MPPIFAFIVHRAGVADDTAAEMAAAARKIDAAQPAIAVVTGWGPELDTVCENLRGSYAEIWRVANQALAYPNAEVIRQALVKVLPHGSIVLAPHGHLGADLSPGLSIKLDAAYAADVIDIVATRPETEAGWLKVVRPEFGGQFHTHVLVNISAGAVLNLRPGAFRSADNVEMNGQVVDKSAEVGELSTRRRYIETIAAEAGDVDISKEPVLVSIGRGIQEQENVAIAENLAEAMGAVVSCSRPVVDSKWLDKSRQVGSSGQTVRPKVYLACGMSGSFQHLAGIKGTPFIVAINRNPKAPIFQVADVGIVADILEFLPALAERVRADKLVGSKGRK